MSACQPVLDGQRHRVDREIARRQIVQQIRALVYRDIEDLPIAIDQPRRVAPFV